MRPPADAELAEVTTVIQVRIDDLAYARGDAIAWPVNAELKPMTPLLRRLEVAGGRALASQLRTQDSLPVAAGLSRYLGWIEAETNLTLA